MAHNWHGWGLPSSYWGPLLAGISQGPFEFVEIAWNRMYYPTMITQSFVTSLDITVKEEDVHIIEKEPQVKLLDAEQALINKPEKEDSIITEREEETPNVKEKTPSLSKDLQSADSQRSQSAVPSKQPYQRFRKYRNLLYQNHRELHDALKASVRQPPLAQVLEECEYQLRQEIRQKHSKYSFEKQMQISRKNVTQSYIELFKFALRLLEVEGDIKNSQCINKVTSVLSRKFYTISTILEIYRSPESAPLLTFLREDIFTDKHIPELVIALDIKLCDKLMMLKMMPGFLYALHNPNEEYWSWDLKAQRESGSTQHIIQAIQDRGIQYKEVMGMLEAAAKEFKGTQNKNNNMSCRYRRVIQRVIKQLHQNEKISVIEYKRLEKIIKRGGKACSIDCLREVLSFPALRPHLQRDFISNGRLMLQILGDGSLKCDTKLRMMALYPVFVRAVIDPDEFVSWRS